MRATIDYEEKNSNEFKVDHNLYRSGHYNEEMEGGNIDFSSPIYINGGRRRGRPTNVPKEHTTATVQRRCQDLKGQLILANE
jgi:hypothetical protein